MPASFLYDGSGKLRQFWPEKVSTAQLEQGLKDVLKTAAKN